MPNFTTAAPKDTSGKSLRLIRTPSPGKFIGIVTCTHLVGCPTHFWHQRTVPCEPPNCEPCAESYPWRWHGYVSCIDDRTHEHLLFEMTAQASETFTEFHKRHHTLIGCKFQAMRANSKPNGRVLITCKVIDLQTLTLPNPPDLAKALTHIWNIPETAVTEQGRTHDAPKLHVDDDHVQQACNRKA